MIEQNQSVLVTGAGGYIGRYVIRQLLDLGAQVIAVDTYLDEVDNRAKKVKLNLFEEKEKLFSQMGKPDVCIHMAWQDGFVHNASSHIEMLSAHFTLMKDLIDAGVGQLVVMGSMHEIGYYEGEVNENTPCNPVSLYGIAKDSLRRSLIAYCAQKDVILQWVRAYYILGDDKRNSSIFAKIMAAAENGQKTFPFTTGQNKYDFISIDDLSRMIAEVALQREVAGIINCCTGNPISLAQKVEEFIQLHNLDITLQYGVYPDRAYDSPAIWGNPDKIKAIVK